MHASVTDLQQRKCVKVLYYRNTRVPEIGPQFSALRAGESLARPHLPVARRSLPCTPNRVLHAANVTKDREAAAAPAIRTGNSNVADVQSDQWHCQRVQRRDNDPAGLAAVARSTRIVHDLDDGAFGMHVVIFTIGTRIGNRADQRADIGVEESNAPSRAARLVNSRRRKLPE